MHPTMASIRMAQAKRLQTLNNYELMKCRTNTLFGFSSLIDVQRKVDPRSTEPLPLVSYKVWRQAI